MVRNSVQDIINKYTIEKTIKKLSGLEQDVNIKMAHAGLHPEEIDVRNSAYVQP